MTVLGRRKRIVRDLHISLARQLVKIKEGQRLPSIRDLAASTQMSLGLGWNDSFDPEPAVVESI